MKLTVFQSSKGDCLMLGDAAQKHHILIDGGMRDSYQEYVSPALGKFAEDGNALDLVYVSHIDQDHIAGVLQLLDDIVAWRVHDFQLGNGNPSHPEPDFPRPPDVKDLWHNAFHELIPKNQGEVADLLAASASILSGASAGELKEVATQQQELVQSIPEAIRVSRRVSKEQLNIPLNRHFDGKLAFVREDENPPAPIPLGTLDISVIGPFDSDLDRLRRDWNKWLKNNKKSLEKLQKKAQRDAERLGTNEAFALLNLRLEQAQELGQRSKVTPPNLASLMLLVEEDGKTILLTGDGHADDILKGLAFHKKLDSEGRIHVDVLKVQHHGAEYNIDEHFVSKVTADHYIFCGNGEHDNPDLLVLKTLIESRIEDVDFRASHPKATGPFKLWFNSNEHASKKAEARSHMEKVKALVSEYETNSNGRMTTEFLKDGTPSFELVI